MHRFIHWFTLTAFAAFLSIAPALAAGTPSSPTSHRAAVPTASAPTAASVARPAADHPVLTARAPFDTVWNTTVTSMNSQALGLQRSAAANNHVRWTIAGAAVGAIIGAIADDPLRDALIGGAVGFAGSYVMRR